MCDRPGAVSISQQRGHKCLGQMESLVLQMLIGGSMKGTVSLDEGQSSQLPAWYKDKETGPDGGLARPPAASLGPQSPMRPQAAGRDHWRWVTQGHVTVFCLFVLSWCRH